MDGRTLIRQALELRFRTAELGQVRSGRASPAVDVTSQKVNECIRPFLTMVLRAAELWSERRGTPDAMHAQIASALEKLKLQLRTLELPSQDVQDIVFALVAYVDELMQSRAGPLRDYWQTHLLQLQQFGDTHGGERFFERLEQARENGRASVLFVAYVCLLLGFQGMYSHHGQLERENLIETVRRALDDHLSILAARPLSPSARRPNEPSVDRKRNRLLQLLALATAIAGSLWYLGLWFTIDARERTLRDRLTAARHELTLGE